MKIHELNQFLSSHLKENPIVEIHSVNDFLGSKLIISPRQTNSHAMNIIDGWGIYEILCKTNGKTKVHAEVNKNDTSSIVNLVNTFIVACASWQHTEGEKMSGSMAKGGGVGYEIVDTKGKKYLTDEHFDSIEGAEIAIRDMKAGARSRGEEGIYNELYVRKKKSSGGSMAGGGKFHSHKRTGEKTFDEIKKTQSKKLIQWNSFHTLMGKIDMKDAAKICENYKKDITKTGGNSSRIKSVTLKYKRKIESLGGNVKRKMYEGGDVDE